MIRIMTYRIGDHISFSWEKIYGQPYTEGKNCKLR